MIPPVVPPELLQRVQDAQNAQAALQTAASAQTRALPSDIFNLTPGSTFNATITQADAKGLLTLSTDAGSFQLRLSVPQSLPAGGTLALQVTQIGDQSAQFRIVSLDGQTLEEAGLRRTHGLTVVAVGRDGAVMANPDGTLRLVAGDTAYIFGPHADITAKAGLFTGRSRPWQ